MRKSIHQAQRLLRGRLENISSKTNALEIFNLLTSDEMLDVIEGLLPEHRERNYPPTLILSMFVDQVLSADSSCQNAVNGFNVWRIEHGLSGFSSGTSAYCQARQRLPLALLKDLCQFIACHLEAAAEKAWLWKGRHVKIVDGTTILMPDTAELQQTYPQHANQDVGCGFPTARMVGVVSWATGALLDLSIAPYQGKETGEHGLMRELLDTFEAGDLLLADGYYASYFLIAELQKRGVDIVMEQHGARKCDFRKGRKVGSKDHVVTWKKPARPSWMSKEQYQRYAKEIKVRELKVKGKVLVTTLMDQDVASRSELGSLYCERWHVELDLRNIKSVLGMEMLSCKSTDMCHKEIWAHMLGYNIIRLLMTQAGSSHKIIPRHLSFKHTLQIWTNLNRMKVDENVMRELFKLIAAKRVGNRAGRVEPRAVKRRPKPYPRLKMPRSIARDNVKLYGHDRAAV